MSNKDTEANAQVPRPNILKEAESIIYGDREKTYGDPARNLKNIANFWNTYLDAFYIRNPDRANRAPLDIHDVCQMMILVKQARLINDPSHRDSKVDICGYAALSDRCATPKREQGFTPSTQYKPSPTPTQEIPNRTPYTENGKIIHHGDLANCYCDKFTGRWVYYTPYKGI